MPYKDELSKLQNGFPQEWVYIERKVLADLAETASDGVIAPANYKGKLLSDIFKKELTDVNSRKTAIIQPVIGANGAGKTQQLQIQVKKYATEIFGDKLVYLFFDLKHSCQNEDEFWGIFLQKLYDEINSGDYMRKLCGLLPADKIKSILVQTFRNPDLVTGIMKSIANDDSTRAEADQYFYGDAGKSKKTIQDFFYGFVKLAMQHDRLVVICFDELQFLIDIDKSQTLIKLVLEQFIRRLLEEFINNRLYILISCLQNPELKEYDQLKSASKNFDTIVSGKEIILGHLTAGEKNELLSQVAAKIGMKDTERKAFFGQVKSRLEYFLPRELLKNVYEVLDKLGYMAYTVPELRKLYESEARDFMKPKLVERGFVHIDDAPVDIGGYHFDIHASKESNRSSRVAQAFGEVTIQKKASMKSKIERFVSWFLALNGKEYRPDLGDHAFFVCPAGRLTPGCTDLLGSRNIEYHEFDSSLINELNTIDVDEDESEGTEEGRLAGEKPPVKPKAGKKAVKKAVVVKKVAGSELNKISGVGAGKAKLLNEAGIFTLQDLAHCSPAAISSRVKGLGQASITKWRQAAKQLLENLSS